MPDGTWRGAGSCTNSYKSGDKSYETWEEGSRLKEYTYKKTGGTGKYQSACGGGTYMYEGVTDTIFGGRDTDRRNGRGGKRPSNDVRRTPTQPRRGELFPSPLRRNRAKLRPPCA